MTLYHGPDLSLGPVSLCLPDVHEIENAPAAPDILEARSQWLARALQGPETLYFAIRVDGLLAGQIFLHELGQQPGEAQVGLHLFDPTMRGRGVGAAALALLQGYVATHTHLKRLVFEVSANQVAAVRAAEKSGFRRKGKSKTDPLQVVYHWDVPAA
ncbi:MAG: GNAT family N-acetyltransferase [Chloroflexi bacterium]|nr:GNAT family N-acetyltransferase [Chloroflexota bacterium]